MTLLTDTEAFLALEGKRTPGEWEADSDKVYDLADWLLPRTEYDAAFIAACSGVGDLLRRWMAECERLRRDRAEIEKELSFVGDLIQGIQAKHEAELAALRPYKEA